VALVSVTAIIVTRGDIDLAPIIGQEWPESVHEIIVWDNAKEDRDLAVYGRYAAIERAAHPLIFVQDDDVVFPKESIEEIIWQSDSGSAEYGRLVVNMPANFRHAFYQEHALVGFGSCFHRDLPRKAFTRFFGGDDESLWRSDQDFLPRCDLVFTGLTPRTLVDVPYEDLPWASADNRMWKRPSHLEEGRRMLERMLAVRDGQ